MSFPAKFRSKCAECHGTIQPGEEMDWHAESRTSYHPDCTPEDKKWKPPSHGSGFKLRSRSDEEKPAHKPFGSPFVNMTVGGNGPRIGILAFNKHIANEMQSKLMRGRDLFTGSVEQDAVWAEILTGESHLVIEAAAGTGKSTTAQQGVLRLIQEKDASARAMTWHSLGLSILRRNYRTVTIDEHKISGIVDQLTEERRVGRAPTSVAPLPEDETKIIHGILVEDDDWYSMTTLAGRLTNLCRNYLEDGLDTERLAELADYHNVDYEERIATDAFKLVPEILRRDQEDVTRVDFSDMTWLPVVKGLQADLFDILIVDEAQDTDRAQQALAKLACPHGRIFVIGDKFQSIYGFRGADTGAMSRLEEMLQNDPRGAKVLPLTVTRRCPVKHVEIAQYITSPENIRAMDSAIPGHISQVTENEALSWMAPGDLVVCRVNRPLVPMCYALIQRGIKAVVRGRDIGAGLEALIKKLGSPSTTDELSDKLSNYYEKEMARLRKKKHAENRMAALEDRCDTLFELMSGTSTISQVIEKIHKIFADFEDDGAPKQAVILGTVHRTKGLEANRVFVLAPELIPHPMATQPWEIEQEANLAYVVCTRSKDELIFVGPIPPIYGTEELSL